MMRLACPAKINLYLKVLGKRSDGFHELATVFQKIDLNDDLSWVDDARPIRLENLGDVDFGEDNLVRRAIRLYSEAANVVPTGSVRLEKRVPIGGGLGGGSSNAASMLMLLNRKHQKLSPQQLKSLALTLGSDVPYFLESGCRWGFGRGENLEPCNWLLPQRKGFLFLPPFGLATAEVFKALHSGAKPFTRGDFSPPGVQALGENDLEVAACRISIRLATMIKTMRERLPGEKVFMSGSGSTLVCLTDRPSLPKTLHTYLRENDVRSLPFAFLDESDNREPTQANSL